MSAIPNEALSDPLWMPLGYDAPTDRFRLVRVEDEVLADAAFLDQRVGSAWEAPVWIDASMRLDVPSQAAPAWLFHTAFCCSTLLARALHSPPQSISLKEPSVLLDLAHLSLSAPAAGGLLQERTRNAVRLLARPRYPGSRMLIKPTNPANRLIPALLAQTPASRALLLYGDLENFLMSSVKKLPGAEEPMRWMAGYLLPGTRLQRTLAIPKDYRLNFIEACVLTWFAQMEIYADALDADKEDRLRSLDMQVLLRQPAQTVGAVAAWLDLGTDERQGEVEARISAVFSRNSKQASASYGPERRSQERDAIMARYGDLIRAALSWSERDVAPHATLPTEWKALIRAEPART